MDLDRAIAAITTQRTVLPDHPALVVAISGIDGAGKGYLTNQLAARIEQQNLRVASIKIDGWLNPRLTTS